MIVDDQLRTAPIDGKERSQQALVAYPTTTTALQSTRTTTLG